MFIPLILSLTFRPLSCGAGASLANSIFIVGAVVIFVKAWLFLKDQFGSV